MKLLLSLIVICFSIKALSDGLPKHHDLKALNFTPVSKGNSLCIIDSFQGEIQRSGRSNTAQQTEVSLIGTHPKDLGKKRI